MNEIKHEIEDCTSNSTPEGTTMDLKEREWGHIGVTIIQGTLGWTMLAPAAKEYAVLPVGVAIMTPEAISKKRK